MSQLFASCGQSIGALASASVLPMNIQAVLIFFRIDWFDLLAVQGKEAGTDKSHEPEPEKTLGDVKGQLGCYH